MSTPISFGINKAARLRAEFETEGRLEAPPALDPEFPYEVRPFDASFFGVKVNSESEE